MSRIHRLLALLMVLIVPAFLAACEAEPELEDEELGTETETFETTPTEPLDGTGDFSAWDADADASLTEDEFATGFGGGTWWTDWDADANTALSQEEFDSAFSDRDWYEAGLYGEWDGDADGELTEEELNTGLFDVLDENDDSMLDEMEFDSDLFAGMM